MYGVALKWRIMDLNVVQGLETVRYVVVSRILTCCLQQGMFSAAMS